MYKEWTAKLISNIKPVIIAILLVVFQNASSQPNLVPNPGFEDFTGTWTDRKGGTGLGNLKFWTEVTGTCDWLDTIFNLPCINCGNGYEDLKSGCNTGIECGTAHTDRGVMGISTNPDDSGPYYEHATVRLTSPMITGKLYKVSFWIRSAFNDAASYRHMNDYGMYFSVNAPVPANSNVPQGYSWSAPGFQYVKENTIVGTDHLGHWEYYEWFICAKANHNYVVIGAMGNLTTTLINYPPGKDKYNSGGISPYAHFDDIVVEEPRKEVGWSSPPNPMCKSDAPIDLRTFITTGDPSSVFLINGVPGNIFDPSMYTGVVDIRYRFTPSSVTCSIDSVIPITIVSTASAAWSMSPKTICPNGNSVYLPSLVTGTANGTFSGTGVVSGDNFDPALALPGSYAVITYSVNAGSCGSDLHKDSVYVTQVPVSPIVLVDDSICLGESGTISIQAPVAGVNYKIYDAPTGGSLLGSAPLLVSPSTTTNYYVEAEQGGCGSSRTPVKINVFSASVNAGVDVTIAQGDSVQLQASIGASSYSWLPSSGLSCSNCSAPIAKPVTTTTYTVTATSPEGCISNDMILVTVDNACKLFVASAFSPNGDKNNDELCVHIITKECLIKLDFRIYNRWGEEVFHTTDIDNCWDGKYKGQALNTATFSYQVSATLQTGEAIQQEGNITLMK